MDSHRSNLDLPEVFTYLDYRVYLNHWLESRKATSTRYTLSMFARLAGCTASHCRNVFDSVRDLLPPYVDGFIRALHLDEDEAEFFTLLVRHNQAPTHADKARVMEQISGLRRFREARPLQGEQFLCLARPAYVAIYELARCAGFHEDPAWIASTLRPQITATEASSALADLQAVNLLIRNEAGRLVPASQFLATGRDVRDPAAIRFHEAVLDLVQQASADGPRPDRSFSLAVAALPSSRLESVREAVTRFHHRLDAILANVQAESIAADHRLGGPDVIYQFSVQLFPVSEVIPPAETEKED